ncbi:MAG TPA: HDIG domain-containing protein [Chloroflexota bacterium]
MNANLAPIFDPPVQRLIDVFRASGEQLYLVGGAVRDRLLGVTIDEVDFATSAYPERTLALLAGLNDGAAYRIGEKFGTIAWVYGGRTVEITTYRAKEVYVPGSRKPQVRFGSTLIEDLSRRDFTINAIAQEPVTGEFTDPFGGIDDLRRRLLRAVGRPEDRFVEDPLRLLRAVRFSSRLCLSIEPATSDAIVRAAHTLRRISRERIRDEYNKMLLDSHVVRALELLRDCGLLAHSVPELLDLTRMPDHGPRHPLSLWDHVMQVVSGVPPTVVLRWAALLHDIAKPITRTTEPLTGRPRFFHHEEIGAKIARKLLSELRFSNQTVEEIALLVETHMQLHAYSETWSDGAVRRLLLRLGPCLDDALLLARADAAGHTISGESRNSPRYDQLSERILELEQTPVATLTSPLTGDDLMERYNRSPGPWIRQVKDALLEEVLEGRLQSEDRERAWAIADGLIKGMQ